MVLLLFNRLKLIPAFCREPTTVHPSHTKMARTHRFREKKIKIKMTKCTITHSERYSSTTSRMFFTALMPEPETHVVRKSLRLPKIEFKCFLFFSPLHGHQDNKKNVKSFVIRFNRIRVGQRDTKKKTNKKNPPSTTQSRLS